VEVPLETNNSVAQHMERKHPWDDLGT
jgi:hypothetical protein